MKNHLVLAVALISLAAAQARPDSSSVTRHSDSSALHPLGLIREDPRTIPWMVQDKLVYSPPRRLGQVDLSDQMPPVGNQGTQGSCTAWAIGYYQKTHYEWLEHSWDLNQSSHQFSPAFIYNQINGGADQGSGFASAFALISDQGAGTMADCPYNQNDCTTWPSESAYTRAIPFRGGESHWFEMDDSTGISMARQRLDSGLTTVLSIEVYSNFDNIQNYHYTYCVSDTYGGDRGSHAVTIVGYNDTMTTHDGTGAFKMINSWGTNWGLSGYWWMSYEAARNANLTAQAGYYLDDRIAYSPTMYGRAQLTHAARDKVGLRLGVGSTVAPNWQKNFRTWRYPRTDRPFPGHNIVFDLTEGEPYITNGQADSVFVRAIDDVSDGKTGTIDYFAAEHLPWNSTAVSNDTPVTIPDYNTGVYARARFPLVHDVGVTQLIAPAGIIDSGTTLAPQARVRNFGTEAAAFAVLFRTGTYADTQNVGSLAAGDSALVTFASWTATTRGVNVMRCTTRLEGDGYHANDYKPGVVSVRVRDIACTRLLAPPDTVDSGSVLAPRAVLKNVGTTNETFGARFAIGSDYADTVSITLSAGRSDTIDFAAWQALALGTFPFTCAALLATDMNPANDQLTDSVTVGVYTSVADEPELPRALFLGRPAPDPMRGRASVRYSVPAGTRATITIRSATGALVRALLNSSLLPAPSSLTWNGLDDNGRRVAPGIYFWRLETGSAALTRKTVKLD